MRRVICFALLATRGTIAAAPPSSAVGVSTIEGRWKTKKATLQELLAAGVPRKIAEALARAPLKTPALDFHNGAVKGLDLDTGKLLSTGTYLLQGNTIRFVFKSGGYGVEPGKPYDLRWNVYRDRLTFSSLPGRQTILKAFVIHPWTRVR